MGLFTMCLIEDLASRSFLVVNYIDNQPHGRGGRTGLHSQGSLVQALSCMVGGLQTRNCNLCLLEPRTVPSVLGSWVSCRARE